MSSANTTIRSRRHPVVSASRTPLVLAIVLGCASFGSSAATFPLGSAGSFGALASQTVTCTGASAITGDVGVSPGTSVVGFPPCSLTGNLHVTDSAANSGIADAGTAFTALAGLAPDADMTGTNLGGLTLSPGVYKFTSGGQLTGGLTLDGQGQVDPLFVFQFVSGLVIDSGSAVNLINGAVASNVFFQVGTSATLDTTSNIAGTIIAGASVSLATGASLNGRALALTGGVSLDGNAIVVPLGGPSAPPPPPPPPPPQPQPSAQKRVLFVNPADNPNQQTFVRFINPNPVANEVTIVGYDDSGAAGLDAQMTLALPAQATMQLNASDLELGNPAKGLTGRLGDGIGKWQLKLNSPQPIVVMSLIRTPDGFLTSVSEEAPRLATGDHSVVTANPSSNQAQQGFIRVVNPSADSGMVFVSAIDDAGNPAPGGDLEFELGPFQSLNFNSLDYTLGNLAKGLSGALGEGIGAWHFTVRSTLNLGVMGLIRTPDGFVTNLSHSAPRSAPDDSADRMMFTVNPGNDNSQQSMIRLINNDAEPAVVVLSGIDDSGVRAPDSVYLTLPPNAATEVLASDLEQSNAGAGVFSNFGGFGTGTGRWQVTMSQQQESNVDAQSLMLVPGGFLTNLSGTVPHTSLNQVQVWIVNPASNTNQRSVLRVVNRSTSAGAVLIEAIDDAGVAAPGGSATLTLPARAAVELTAQDLEQGNPGKGMQGALGDGSGKWRMVLTADVEIDAQSQLTTPSGFFTDLSRVVE